MVKLRLKHPNLQHFGRKGKVKVKPDSLKGKVRKVASGPYFVEACSQTRTLAANFPLERQDVNT